jgi:predicted metallopeptidase
MAKEKLTYWKSEEIADIAEQLIASYHEHLAGETIIYLFRSEHSEEKGKITLGKARKITGLNAFLATKPIEEEPVEPPVLYVIEIAYDTWLKLTGPQRIALVDHELQHITPDGLRAHDVEEFRAIVARHGMWKPDLKDFLDTARQKPLFEAVEDLRPKKGSGITGITISAGGKSVTLLPRDEVH